MSSWGVGLGDYPIEKKDDKDKKDKKEKKGKPKKDKEAEDKDAASKRRRANTAGGVAAPGALLEGAAAADDENTARLSNFKLGKAHTGLLRTSSRGEGASQVEHPTSSRGEGASQAQRSPMRRCFLWWLLRGVLQWLS